MNVLGLSIGLIISISIMWATGHYLWNPQPTPSKNSENSNENDVMDTTTPAPASKWVSDEEVAAHMEPVFIQYAKYFAKEKNAEENKIHAASQKRSTSNQNENKEASVLKDEQILFLTSIKEEPFWSATKHQDMLGLSSYMGNKIKSELKDAGYIKQYTMNFGKLTGGTVVFYELTSKGYKSLGIKPPATIKKWNCSSEHFCWQRVIAYYSKKNGYNVKMEYELPNEKRVDLVIKKKGWTTGIEVEISAKNVIQNAMKDLEDNTLDKLLVACRNQKTKQLVEQKLEEALTEHQKKRLQVMLLSEFHFVKDIVSKTKA